MQLAIRVIFDIVPHFKTQVLSGQMILILHFLGFCWAHCEMQLMSFCRDGASPKLVTSDIVTSLTYFQWLERRGERMARSLIIIKKRIGPNLVSWGTPASTGIHSEMESKSLTAWRRPLRKLHIQLINQPLTPRWISLVTKMVKGQHKNNTIKFTRE